jgi:DNA-binding transcriptional LysR family regulator
MSDLDRYELFIEVAQAQSLTQAAEQLGITKASLSKQMKRLESDLKVDLFSRAGYRLSLTPFGERLLEQCLHLKRALDDTRSLCDQLHEQPKGDLHVTAFCYFAQRLIFPRLKAFQDKYPQLTIHVDLEERLPNFDKSVCDIALGFSLPTPQDYDEIIQVPMGSTRYVLCGSPSYFIQAGKPERIEDLQDHRLISHPSRGQQHLKFAKSHAISVKPMLYVNRVEAMIECSCLGLGLVQLPIYMLEDYLKQGDLVEVLPDVQMQQGSIYYYYPKYRYIQPKIRAFIDFFLKDKYVC